MSATGNLTVATGNNVQFRITDSGADKLAVSGTADIKYLDNGGSIQTAYAAMPSQSWTTPVSSTAADRAVFGAGMTTLIGDRWSLFGRYDQKLWQGGYSTNFSVGVKVSF